MIAIIPAAGLGTRFLPTTSVVPKEMLPIGNRPALELLVEEARSAGAKKIVIIISHHKELIREYFKDATDIEFVYQEEQHGLGHAILQAGASDSLTSFAPSSAAPVTASVEQVGEEGRSKSEEGRVKSEEVRSAGVLILLGDAMVFGCNASKAMIEFSKAHGRDGVPSPSAGHPNEIAVIGCEEVAPEKVSRYGIMKLEGDRIVDMVEKPSLEEAPSRIAVAGRYFLPGKIFDYLKTQTPGKGNEIQLTDSIRRMIADGYPHYAFVYPGGHRHDIGNPDGYFETLKAFYEQH